MEWRSQVSRRGVLKTIDGRIQITFFHVELADFEIFFRAQADPT